MKYEKSITFLHGGAVMAECGPMRIVISAYVGKVPQTEMATRAAKESFLYLERIAKLRDLLARSEPGNPESMEDPLAARMVESVQAVFEKDLSPMAAVAGTIADGVADFLFDRGMTKVVVDNGGDIAARCKEGESVRIGIRPEIRKNEISHIIELDSQSASWGIATSGLGGRSFTRGIASATTAIAHQASMADAAATAIANASFVRDENVIQRRAGEIDPNTDISHLLVTVKAGPLSQEKEARGLHQALERADRLSEKGVILGAFVAVGRQFAMTDFLKGRVMAV